jgi:hypothetical protein
MFEAHDLIWGVAIASSVGTGENHENLVIASVPAEIQTWYPQNTSQNLPFGTNIMFLDIIHRLVFI